MTMRAKEFIAEQGDQPWLCHLSFIKPHWPYMAPSPYHDMYGPETFKPVHRSPREKDNPNPVYDAFMGMEVSETFSKDQTRETVMPAYMGLIKQIDDHLGRLFDWLEETGCDKDTMIVMTSDHGDYLGDHWMGEKELFHEASVRVPLIIYDPRPEADATRGTVCDKLVEAIDLVPTFLEATGAPDASQRLEGRSLQPILHATSGDDWRTAVFSEIDYAFYAARKTLGSGPSNSRGYMIRTNEWKYVHFVGYPPQLFDLVNDPEEFEDHGRDPEYSGICAEMHGLLTERLLARKNRVALSDKEIDDILRGESNSGIMIGKW